jgi:membrane-associated protease RseP (regulator of RpoE activity)
LSNELHAGSPDSGETPVFRYEPSDPGPPLAGDPFQYVYRPRVRFQHVWSTHILLLALTLVTTTIVGGYRYESFLNDFGRQAVSLTQTQFLTNGLWYSGTVLAILGAHEMGHYIACRIYKIDATLPYFLPLYFWGGAPLQIGTLGAVIRIREAFPNRKALFDVGVAGPIAGFVFLVPALFVGMYLSNVTVSPPAENLMVIGKPLLFRAVRWLVFGPIPDGSIVNLHPMVWAAWFGMLATALNLLPFGQLDGGHITYATLGKISTPISLLTVASAVVMTFFSLAWLLMTLLMLAMLFVFGARHPPVLNSYEPLDGSRRVIALCALVMLVICFTPFPIELRSL